jgi:Arc/MetJ-type ribon-helix-helix transcriptional regulator
MGRHGTKLWAASIEIALRFRIFADMIPRSNEADRMNISLSPKTSRMLARRMKRGGFGTPEEAVRTALETVDQAQGEDIEDLDEDTQAAINRAFAQSRRGDSRPWARVREELRAKYPGR